MIRRDAYQQSSAIPGVGLGGIVQNAGPMDRIHRCILGAGFPGPRSWAFVLIALVILFPVAANAQVLGKRIALVIGNTRYASIPLVNPENDAKAVSSTLRRLGFQVTEHLNLKARNFRRVMRDFARRIQDEEGAAVFYYAGHGVQIDGRNFLLPVDINLRDAEEVKDDSIDIDEVFVSRIERGRMNVRIIILDACRDNPFRNTVTRNIRPAGGLAEMNARGALIAYSSAPGAAAEDGVPGTNSVFTRHLVQEMVVEGVEVEQMFKNVRVKVLRDTNQRQIPWTNTSLTANFSFNPARGPSPAELARIEQERKVKNSLIRFQEERKGLLDEQARLEQELDRKMAELDAARRALAIARSTPATFEAQQRETDQRLLADLDRQEQGLLRLQEELERARRKAPPSLVATQPRSSSVAAVQSAEAIRQERERRLLKELDREERDLLRMQAELERSQAGARPGATRSAGKSHCSEILDRVIRGDSLQAADRAYLQKECQR